METGAFYCAVCAEPMFFTDFIRDMQGDIKALCNDHALTHELRVEPIDPGPANEQMGEGDDSGIEHVYPTA
jgi:hypothetical protein